MRVVRWLGQELGWVSECRYFHGFLGHGRRQLEVALHAARLLGFGIVEVQVLAPFLPPLEA